MQEFHTNRSEPGSVQQVSALESLAAARSILTELPEFTNQRESAGCSPSVRQGCS